METESRFMVVSGWNRVGEQEQSVTANVYEVSF